MTLHHSIGRDPLEALIKGEMLPDLLMARLLDPIYVSAERLAEAASDLTLAIHGNGVLVRGLLEITNICRNGCLYCGIRAGNNSVSRYCLDQQQIMDCCREAYGLGFRTIVMQGGEHPTTDPMVADIVDQITSTLPGCAVTLSLGERPHKVYEMWREAGASRYLLRHETASHYHYSSLHPTGMTLLTRLKCLESLRSLGYQVGTGMMVGSPGQDLRCLLSDLRFIRQFRPEMVGIGPFIPHPATPLGHYPAGSVDTTLRLISIIRLMLPSANIPATTALATLAPDGRRRGILAGANVVMPNISPARVRADYALYSGKACLGAEAAEGLALLADDLNLIGRSIDFSRGDFKPHAPQSFTHQS